MFCIVPRLTDLEISLPSVLLKYQSENEPYLSWLKQWGFCNWNEQKLLLERMKERIVRTKPKWEFNQYWNISSWFAVYFIFWPHKMVAISRNKLVYLTINKCNNDFIDDNVHSVGTAQLFFKYFITYGTSSTDDMFINNHEKLKKQFSFE